MLPAWELEIISGPRKQYKAPVLKILKKRREKGGFWILVQIFKKKKKAGRCTEWVSITYGICELVLGSRKE